MTLNAAPPVVLDTNHDGQVGFLGIDAGVLYDINGDGSPRPYRVGRGRRLHPVPRCGRQWHRHQCERIRVRRDGDDRPRGAARDVWRPARRAATRTSPSSGCGTTPIRTALSMPAKCQTLAEAGIASDLAGVGRTGQHGRRRRRLGRGQCELHRRDGNGDEAGGVADASFDYPPPCRTGAADRCSRRQRRRSRGCGGRGGPGRKPGRGQAERPSDGRDRVRGHPGDQRSADRHCWPCRMWRGRRCSDEHQVDLSATRRRRTATRHRPPPPAMPPAAGLNGLAMLAAGGRSRSRRRGRRGRIGARRMPTSMVDIAPVT